jgi:hypothetical protein
MDDIRTDSVMHALLALALEAKHLFGLNHYLM